MASQVEVLAPGLGFPDDQAVVAVASGQQDAIGAELDGGDPLGVLLHLEHHVAVGRIVNPHDLARAAERDLAVIGADVGGEHGVVLLADLEDPLAGLHVERDGQARLPAAAAADQQQIAVAAEPEHVDRALGEGQHADEVVVGRPVEQHLLVSADGHQGAQGLAAMATTALGLACGTNGSVDRFSGMAGVPAGLARGPWDRA